MNEYKLDNITLMGGWFIPEKVCDNLIEYFNNNKNLHRLGHQGTGGKNLLDTDVKESTDLSIKYNAENEYTPHLHKCLDLYIKKYDYINQQPKFGLTRNYQIQHYKKGGGYKKWHFENSAKIVLDRCLVFMTFLNDVDDGGTDFLYQNLTIPAKKGLTLIWPAYWTHTHKSQVTKTKEKYIITGWLNYV